MDCFTVGNVIEPYAPPQKIQHNKENREGNFSSQQASTKVSLKQNVKR